MNPLHLPPEDAPAPRVLVAEDHPDSREALRALLEATGHEVHVATNGREAVELAVALRPQLILMDVMMPDVDGLQATRTLRGRADFERIPIVALTAMEGARERVTEAGMDDYVSKPIEIATFFEKLRHWLERGRG